MASLFTIFFVRYALSGDVDASTNAPENVQFFEIIKEFSRSLHKQDGTGVVQYLEVRSAVVDCALWRI